MPWTASPWPALPQVPGQSEGSGPAPILVCLQAGNVHSGAFDPFAAAIAVSKAHGAWVHVDGAFGLWAAAVPELAGLTAGVEGADSWATDAHKSLNVPYDCGIAVVRDPQALRSAMGQHASYLLQDADGSGDPSHKVPELSRRARGVPVWAALKSLGRDGVAEQVRRLATSAARLAEQLAAIDGVEVLNDVGFTQISLAFGDDATTRGRGGQAHCRRNGVDVRFPLARQGRGADIREQLDHRRRRRRHGGGGGEGGPRNGPAQPTLTARSTDRPEP